MSLEVLCAQCGRKYQNVKPELAGRPVRCKCGNDLQVPELEPDGLDVVDLLDPDSLIEDLLMPGDIPVDDIPPLGSTMPRPGTYPSPPPPRPGLPVPGQPPGGQSLPGQGPTAPLPGVQQPVPNPTGTQRPGMFRPGQTPRTSRRSPMRPVETLFMVVGIIVAVWNLSAILGLVYGIVGLFTGFGIDAGSTASGWLMAIRLLGLLSSVAHISLGFCGGAVALYVYEKRNYGKSSYQWGFQSGAIAGAACLAISVVNSLVYFLFISRLASSSLAGISMVSMVFGLAIGSICPVAMIWLYLDRKKLNYDELL